MTTTRSKVDIDPLVDTHSKPIDTAVGQRFYDKKYLQEAGSPKLYLKSIAYAIQLNGLLQVKDCCAYHEEFEYFPVQTEIMDPKLQEVYKGKFLLQVWTSKGKVAYQKVLQYQLKAWNVFDSKMIYQLDPREEKGFFYIVYFEQKNAIIQIKDFVQDYSYCYFGYKSGYFLLANENDILMAPIDESLIEGQVKTYEVVQDKIKKTRVEKPLKIHGFFENQFSREQNYNLMLIELEDNQMSIQRLYWWTETKTFEFLYYRETIIRQIRNDPIVKYYQVVKSDQYQFGIALRQSGYADLYYNYGLINTSDEIYDDVNISFQGLYLKKLATRINKLTLVEESFQQVQKMDTKWGSRIGFHVQEAVGDFKLKKWTQLKFKPITEHMNLYSSMVLANASFIVSTTNLICIYNLREKKWVQTIQFDWYVKAVLRMPTNSSNSDIWDISVVLENGKLYKLTQFSDYDEWKLHEDVQDLNGKVHTVITQWKYHMNSYALVEQSNKTSIYVLDVWGHRELTNVQIRAGSKNEDQVVRLISEDQDDSLVIYNQNQGQLRLYNGSDLSSFQEYQVILSNFELGEPEYDPKETIKKKIKAKEQKRNVKLRMCIKTSKFGDESLIIITTYKVYLLNLNTKKISEGHNFSCTNTILLDDQYFYSLTAQTEKADPGFYIQSIDSFMNSNGEVNFQNALKLKNILGGQANYLEYYQEEERIIYQGDFQTVKIIPVLHRNTLTFFGMKSRQNYIAFKRIKDLFIALDNQMTLITWSVITGKIIQIYKIKEDYQLQDYTIFTPCTDYDTYKKGWYNSTTLLINTNEELTQVDQEELFGDRFKRGINGGRPAVEIDRKNFYRFKVIEILNSAEITVHFQFVHPKYTVGYQRIYFSQNKLLMLERLQNQKVILYKREDKLLEKDVKWNIVKMVLDFSTDLSELSYNNYLFSTDLKYYLDFNRSKNIFTIKDFMQQKVILSVPQGLMNPKNDDPVLIAKKFHWISPTKFKVINNEGFEKLVDIASDNKVIGHGKVPMLDIDSLKNQEKMHFYVDKRISSITDTEERLLGKVQEFYSAQVVENIVNHIQLYEIMFAIDYGLNECKAKPIVDLSFTFLHWKIAELLQRNDDRVNIDSLTQNDVKLISLNIFPQGRNVLHYIYGDLNHIKYFYQSIQKINKTQYPSFNIPFFRNFKRESPLHLCMNGQNYQSVNAILQFISQDDFGNHSRAICDLIPLMVKEKIPSLSSYFTSRIKQTKQLEKFRKAKLKEMYGIDYTVAAIEQWGDADDVKHKLFVQSTGQKIESEITIKMFDVPNLHCFQEPIGNQFFKELSLQYSIDIFDNEAIRALIDFKWPLVKRTTIYLLFIPFLLYLAVFVTFSNVFNGQVDIEEDTRRAKIVLIALLYFFSLYFLIHELIQIFNLGRQYLRSYWNLSDFIPPMLIIITISFHLKELSDSEYDMPNFIYTIHSVASLLLWVKFLYFLRIFKHTGYFIRMLSTVIWDIRVFIFILLIVYIGFGEAFLRLSEVSDDAAFLFNYAYSIIYSFRLSIGDNDTDSYNEAMQPVTLWFMFVASILFTNIIMLNLLISIISDSFGKVNSNAENANYQERCGLISENLYLIPPQQKIAACPKDHYLVIAKQLDNLGDDGDDEGNNVFGKIDDLDDQIKDFKTEITTKVRDLDEKLTQIIQKLDSK